VTHYPLIKIIPFHVQLNYSGVTHLIVTSQSTVELITPPKDLMILAVGQKTASRLKNCHVKVAAEECAEGIIELLRTIDPQTSTILYPHSAKARPLIADYLREHGYRFIDTVLYDVAYQAAAPLPDLGAYDRVIFTSPSTVDAFFSFFKTLPAHLEVDCIGPITRLHLTKKLHRVSV
jgi:uroporphyrinogen-III synthase